MNLEEGTIHHMKNLDTRLYIFIIIKLINLTLVISLPSFLKRMKSSEPGDLNLVTVNLVLSHDNLLDHWVLISSPQFLFYLFQFGNHYA